MSPAHEALTLRIAARYGNHPRVIEAAREAMERALEAFEPSRGVPFSRFARHELRRRCAKMRDRVARP